MPPRHRETHKSERIGWLRAAVLGANDGIISVSSLVVGVAASGVEPKNVLLAGIAGLVSGAMSMAAGEYVSVQSQADTEAADLEKEKRELATQPESEMAELTQIYVERGLDKPLARAVAEKLMSGNALEAHARDELGITETLRARPLQAALASAVSFVAGALVPTIAILIAPAAFVGIFVTTIALITLAITGGIAARIGGASIIKGAFRVAFWGALAMALTAGIGKLFGTSI